MKRLIKTGTVGGRALQSTLPTRVRYVAVPAEGIPIAIRWSFLLFVFTLPFEATPLFGSLSLARISGLLFAGLYFLYHNPLTQKRSLPAVPPVMWWFLGYVAIYVLNVFFVPEEFASDFFTRLLTLVQLLVVFWLTSALLEKEEMARSMLLSYSIASAILALGILFRLPGLSETIEETGGRVTALGENPNTLATLMALAAVILMGLRLNKAFRHFVSKTLLVVLTLPLLVVMVSTGSRAGVGAFIIGCSVFLSPNLRSKRTLTAIILGIIGIVAIVYLAASNPDFAERWYQTYYEGNLAGRDYITYSAIEMFLERPIFGWQPIEFWHELGFRVGIWGEKDTHNLFLHLLLEVGVVGTIPFLVGLWLCALAAWRARAGNLGLLPFALLLTILAANMTHTGLTWKPLWLILALTVASATGAERLWGKAAAVLLVGRRANSSIRSSP